MKKVVLPNGQSYAGDRTAPVLVFGDSFVITGSEANASLFAHISLVSGIPARNLFSFMAYNEGPSRIESYIKRAQDKPKIIVWVFISRKLMRGITRD